jgi:hypothetical protein
METLKSATIIFKEFKFKHLEEKGIGYCKHFRRAFGIGASMVYSGSKTMIHAVWPDIFESAATNRVAALQEELAEELKIKKGREKKKE